MLNRITTLSRILASSSPGSSEPTGSKGGSVGALILLELQTDTTNIMTSASVEMRHAQYLIEQAGDDAAAKEKASTLNSDRLTKNTEQIVRAILFAEEAELKSPIAGTYDFTSEFASRGPKDSEGRSLRDFDLQTRMFKYPCSCSLF